MADPADPAKKENPRYEALIGGSGSAYYIAARYFNKSPEEWDALPWYIATCYIEGLHDQGILGDGSNRNATPPMGGQPGRTPLKSVPVDYADAVPLPRGFKTRRAG